MESSVSDSDSVHSSTIDHPVANANAIEHVEDCIGTSNANEVNGREGKEQDIFQLLTVEEMTNDWPLNLVRKPAYKTFAFWLHVLQLIEEDESLTLKKNIPIIMQNLQFECSNVSSFVRKVRNMKDKAAKKNDCSMLNTPAISHVKVLDIGQECKKLNIDSDWLNSPSEIDIKADDIPVSRQLIIELRNFKKSNGISDSQCAEWIKYLFKQPVKVHLGTLRLQWEMIYNKKESIKSKDERTKYLQGKYTPSSKLDVCECKNKPSPVKNTPVKLNEQKMTKVSEQEVSELKKNQRNLNYKLYTLSKQNKNLEKKLDKWNEKVGTLSARNVNKRIKRRDKKIDALQSENSKLQRELSHLQKTSNNIKKKYKNQRSLLRYYKKSKSDVTDTVIPDEVNTEYKTLELGILKDQIKYLENKNLELNEKMQDLMKTKEVVTFHGGKYSNTVREVYATLLSLNVGVKNIETVIRTVLSKLADVNISRLPKKTFSEIMLVEAKILAQIQGAEAILKSDNCTLHTDGTKRGGREYGGLQIGTCSGQYSLGIHEMPQGDTASFLFMIKQMFNDLSKLVDNKNTETKTAEMISKVKNMMTDRHVVNDSLRDSLEKWKNDCLPLIIENFNSFPEDIKRKFVEINHFTCNLHVLVNLGSQAETALKEWEKSVIISKSNNVFDSTQFSVNTSDFIRATTKLCVRGADEKSGYGLLFLSYLQSLEEPVDLELSTFHGHRINILFSMAAGVYYHLDHIKEFINSYFPDKTNKLVSSVSNYILSDVHTAGCRALGVIDKLLTGPLWRKIEAATHILDLNDVWSFFLNNLERLSTDASELLDGKQIFPDFTTVDKVSDILFKQTNEEFDVLTIEALQVLCTNFLIIIYRQLGDYLPGGKFNKDTCTDFEELRLQSKHVSTTNIISERDFANLDRIKREKPNANLIAIEGMILYTVNWLDKMDTAKKEQIFDMARKCAPQMIQEYKNRKAELKKKHVEQIKKKKDDLLALQRKKNEEIIKLNTEIEKYGGLWKSEAIVHSALKKIHITKRLDAVKSQLKYRKTVLKANPSNKTILQFSSQNRQFSLDELTNNLILLIQSSNINTNPETNETIQQSFFQIKSKEEREIFMKENRIKILAKIEEIKSKQKKSSVQTTASEPTSSTSSEPKKRKPKTTTFSTLSEPKKRKLNATVPNNSIPNNAVIMHAFQTGQMVAVAYSDTWFPGQVLTVLPNNFAKIKFLHPLNSKNDTFRWPDKDDITDVENIFVFFSNFNLQARDSMGRTWTISDVQNIKDACNSYLLLLFLLPNLT